MTSYKKSLLKTESKMHVRTGARGHPSTQYLWIIVLRTLEINQIINAF